jgi:hypothetical protein
MGPAAGKEQELLLKNAVLDAGEDRSGVKMATLADDSQHRKDWMLLLSGKLELVRHADVRRRK